MAGPAVKPPALDPDVVAQLRQDLDVDDLRQICRLMEEDAAFMLAALTDAHATGDAEGWKHAAHRLAGGAGGLGATRLEAEARHAMAEGLAQAATRLPPLAEAVQEACAALRLLRA
jgi:HPt (histidine-containing phosphotransfer) domain-containing protein